MKKNLILMNVLLFLIAGIVNGQTITQTNTQFPNPGFEKWKRHAGASYNGSDTAQRWVPFNWHTFDEASCSLLVGCGTAQSNHHNSVNYKNSTMQQFSGSGANNTKHIGIKCTSVNILGFSVKANGALSTGQTEVGSSTATNASNYNYSSSETSSYSSSGQKRWPFVGCPDSMAFYYYTNISNGTVQPLFKVYLHESGEFRDRANGTLWGASTTRLIASSVDTFNQAGSSSSWKRETHPFSYSHPGPQTGTTSNGNTTYAYTFIGQTNQSTHPTYGYYTALNRPSYMLASFSTDKTAGYSNQTSGDLLYIDELWCIYDKGLASLTIGGTANSVGLNVFNSAEYATHEPTRTYDANGNPSFNNSGSVTWNYRTSIACNNIPQVSATPKSKLVTDFSITQATAANGYKATIYVKHNDNSTFYYYIQFTPALPTVTLNDGGTYTACEGDQINITASGASTYSWSNGLGSGATVHPTASGVYTVTGTASNGCTATATANVTIKTRPTVSISGPTSLCQGSTGTLTAVGSFASCVWDDNSTNTTRTITPNRVGQFTYSVLVTGSNSCTNSASTTVNVQATPSTPVVTTISNSNCQAPFNGGITVNSPFGQGFTYSINGTTFQSNYAFNGLQAGVYNVTAQTSAGCQSTLNGVVVANYITEIPVTEITVNDIVGNYIWNGNVYTQSGDYTVTLTAANGCDSTVILHLNFSDCPSIATLPYTENFDSYTQSTTAETGVQPECWNVVTEDVALTNATKPQIYYNPSYATSGNYTLRMKNRCVYAMPELSPNINLQDLAMTFDLRQPNAIYRLQVGVVNANGGFEVVKTINNASTTTESITVNFSEYTGSGKRIAFRNILKSGSTLNYSVNYIDNIKLDNITNICKISELPYTENFDGFTASTTAETGVQPECWDVVTEDVALTTATKPQVYYNASYATSGSYTLRMKNRCVYAMPELDEDINIQELTLSFNLRQPKTLYRLQVGVLNANGGFEVVKTLNNASTETESVKVNFAEYAGSGKRIAFRNTLKSGSTLDYSVNYIDNIELDITPDPCKVSVLPFTENFDNFTTSTTAETGVQPECWNVVTEDVALTTATKPQVYYNASYATSGSYTLRLKNRCVYAMPNLNEDINIQELTLTFNLRQPKSVYRLQVGVVDANGTFTAVKTINNASTGTESISVNFANYAGNGHRIAFRNTLSSSSTLDYSVNYIDNIALDYTPDACRVDVLPFTENFDSFTSSTTAETGVQPECWEVVTEDVALTNSTKPQIYYNASYATSGSYTLRMKNRCVYAMPKLSNNINVQALTMTFKLRQPKSVYRLQVGVVDAQGTFTAVKTINNSSTGTESITVDFSSYTGNGKRIAFRNTLSSSSTLDYSVNYIDDINLNFTTVGKSIAIDENDIDVNADLENITVYPNPTTGQLHIDAMDVQKVECYNQMGQLVGVYENVNEINIRELTNGIYMLRITVPQGVTMRKVVKK